MWYALQTVKGQEENLKKQIKALESEKKRDDWKIFYCVKKKKYLGQWHDKTELFLPGYLFLVTKERNLRISKISEKTEISVFSAPYELDLKIWPVKWEEEEFIERLTRENDEIGMSYGVIRNGVLEVLDGALVGMESRVRKIDRHKRKGYVSIEICGEEVITEIGLEIIEKA